MVVSGVPGILEGTGNVLNARMLGTPLRVVVAVPLLTRWPHC